MPALEPASAADVAVLEQQLGRPPRGIAGIAWRCPCGKPGVVATDPRLPDGTPFPTTYYLTCPRATAGCSTLESQGVMAEMTDRLAEDPDNQVLRQLASCATDSLCCCASNVFNER